MGIRSSHPLVHPRLPWWRIVEYWLGRGLWYTCHPLHKNQDALIIGNHIFRGNTNGLNNDVDDEKIAHPGLSVDPSRNGARPETER